MKKSTNSKKVQESAKKIFVPNYDGMMEVLDKNARLVQGSMSLEARKDSTISTGLLGTDLMIGGGLLGGRWYTMFGAEGSGKSSHLAHMKIAASNSGIPIIGDFDYEGSSTPEYYDGILEYASKTIRKTQQLYGLKDAKGAWVIPPKVRYWNPNVAEDFFNPIASMLRKMPDKLFIENHWFYVWDADKPGRAAAGDKYSKAMYSKYHRLFVEAPDGKPQALFFLDSYPAMFPEALDQDDAGRGMAAIARAMSENCPKIFSKLRPKNVIIVGANQLRQRPAVMYGDPTYEPAGDTIKFVSSCRVRHTPISVPHGKGPIEKESSAIYDDLQDTYRYIKMKAIKNKISTPYLETKQRVWVDDGTGTAHGFDPVWDTFQFLKSTGQLEGSMKKMKITLDGIQPISTDWLGFKTLILIQGKDRIPALKSLKLKADPKIRERCFAQVRSGAAFEMYFANIKQEDVDD